MKKIVLGLSAIAAMASTPTLAAATFGDLAAWQAAVQSYSRDTQYGANFNDINSLALQDGTTMSFDTSQSVRSIGSGWATWSGGYTGQVLTGSANPLNVTFTSGAVSAFGFFAEPDSFNLYDITLNLADGSSIQQAVNGAAGADFFGWAGGPISSYSISTTDSAFAFGDFYVGTNDVTGAVPEPATWAMMFVGFGAVGAGMRRRRAISLRVTHASA